MPHKPVIPSYRLHKPTGQAVATFSGHDHYLGLYDTPASREKYRRLLVEWEVNNRQLPPRPADIAYTVAQLSVAFLAHAETYYRYPDGTLTNEVGAYKQALKALNRLYARLPVGEFSPMKLKAVRAEMMTRGWARSNINRQVARLKSLFKWGVAEEKVPPSVYHGMIAVSGLSEGRSDAAESERVLPAPENAILDVIAVLSPSLRRLIDETDKPISINATAGTVADLDGLAAKIPAESHVAAMAYIQWMTGARPGEICAITTGALKVEDGDWIYHPRRHKNSYRGHDRIIPIGPRAARVLKPFLKSDLSAPIFSPAESETCRHARLRDNRKSPVSPSQLRHRLRRRAKRAPGDRYDVAGYRRAIARACDAAFPLPEELAQAWHEVRTWFCRWMYRHGRPPHLAEYPRYLREARDAVEAFRAAHRWHPHQLRHNTGTMIRARFGSEAAQVALGHKSMAATEIYAERNLLQHRKIMREVG